MEEESSQNKTRPSDVMDLEAKLIIPNIISQVKVTDSSWFEAKSLDINRDWEVREVSNENNISYTITPKNEKVHVDKDQKSVLYLGEATKLHFDGSDVRGTAKLTRYDLLEYTKFLDRLKANPFRLNNKKKVWSFSSGSDSYFVIWGDTANGKNDNSQYKGLIYREALDNKNLILSENMFKVVFGPIDKKIKEYYDRIKNFK